VPNVLKEKSEMNQSRDLTFRVSIAQLAPVLGEIEQNIEKHITLTKQAIKEKANLVLFPELSLTGYSLGKNLEEVSRRYGDPIFAPLVELSKKITVVAGFVELGFAAQIHNSSIVFSGGEVSFLHRKLNLPTYGQLEEGKHFAPGRYLETLNLQDPWQVAVLICSDLWNPALVHLAVVKGAILLLNPVNSADATVSLDFSNPEEWDLVLNFYSRMYGVPILMANRVGEEEGINFWGASRIVDARGREVAKAGSSSEELITAEISYADIVRARARLPTVRDSNLDLIHREIDRLRNAIGYPSIINRSRNA